MKTLTDNQEFKNIGTYYSMAQLPSYVRTNTILY